MFAHLHKIGQDDLIPLTWILHKTCYSIWNNDWKNARTRYFHLLNNFAHDLILKKRSKHNYWSEWSDFNSMLLAGNHGAAQVNGQELSAQTAGTVRPPHPRALFKLQLRIVSRN